MTTTIFCTFDQQDLADLAIGKLRNGTQGIHSVRYLSDPGSEHADHENAVNFFTAWLPGTNYYNGPNVKPSRPVSVRIVCDNASREAVIGKLVNLHAYKIVAS